MVDIEAREPFSKPVALITGAAGGMGQACARRLANTHRLVLADFNQGRLDAACDILREEDNADVVAAICGDITDDATIGQMAQAARDNGGCTILVHTAGLSPALAGWQSIVMTNLVGTAKLLDAVEPLLTPGSVGVILSSIARYSAPPPEESMLALFDHPLVPDLLERLEPYLGQDDKAKAAQAYAYSKRWVFSTVQQLATRWAHKGGRIVSISPGFIITGMTRTEVVTRPEIRARLEATPVGRWGTVNDIANVVEFLISDKASFITGTDIVVDGGLSSLNFARPKI